MTLHFVGFKDFRLEYDERFQRAVRIFGPPDMVHRVWDRRAQGDISPGDTIVFAHGDEHQPLTSFNYDDSAHF